MLLPLCLVWFLVLPSLLDEFIPNVMNLSPMLMNLSPPGGPAHQHGGSLTTGGLETAAVWEKPYPRQERSFRAGRGSGGTALVAASARLHPGH